MRNSLRFSLMFLGLVGAVFLSGQAEARRASPTPHMQIARYNKARPAKPRLQHTRRDHARLAMVASKH